jgi:hypothetical protein
LKISFKNIIGYIIDHFSSIGKGNFQFIPEYFGDLREIIGMKPK